MSTGSDPSADLGPSVTLEAPERQKLTIRRAAVRVIQGPGAGSVHEIAETPWIIGKDEDCDLVLADPTVSGRHAEIGLRSQGYLLSDLDSRNGLWAGGWRVREIFVAPKMVLTLGSASLEVVDLQQTVECALGPAGRLGRAIGRSLAMRRVFGLLESAAHTDSPVLLEGESGTGKGVLAEALHELAGDEERPFVVLDCGALPANLVESELFGHEAGAFTGAAHRRVGALERADGGSLFLDEVGELSPGLQVKLLRAVERGEFRRVGGERTLRSSARIVAATNRNLDQLIRQGQFRSDLYYRLAVVRIRVPPLRERAEDIPLLIEHFLALAGASASRVREVPGLVHLLQSYRWPGNVRELRNLVERLDVLPLPDALPTPLRPAGAEEPMAGFRAAREWAVDQFERAYVEDLLRRTRGNVTRAAELARVTRRYVTLLMTKHGIERGGFVDG